MRYEYEPGATAETPGAVIAYEPAVYEDERLVLTADGRIERMDAARLNQALRGGEAP
jgi:hypothetical protein